MTNEEEVKRAQKVYETAVEAWAYNLSRVPSGGEDYQRLRAAVEEAWRDVLSALEALKKITK